jgi:hypothetical protein
MCYHDAMRTTVTIDPDVQALLRKVMRERGEPFKQVLNAALREGLRGGARKTAKPFRQRTFDLGRPLVDLTKALSLAAELEDVSSVSRARRRASGR